MTNKMELEIAIKKSGKSKLDVSKELGISYMGFYKKLNNSSEFKASEIVILSNYLALSHEMREKIFFSK